MTVTLGVGENESEEVDERLPLSELEVDSEPVALKVGDNEDVGEREKLSDRDHDFIVCGCGTHLGASCYNLC